MIVDEAQKIVDEYEKRMERNGQINSLVAFIGTMAFVASGALFSLLMLIS